MKQKKAMTLFPAIYIGTTELVMGIRSIPQDEIVVVYRPEFVQKFSPKGNFIVDDFSSWDNLLKKIKDWQEENDATFCGILAIDDEIQFRLSKHLADNLDIPFHSLETLDIASNKYLMREAFKKHDVPSVRYRLIDKIDEAALKYVGYPNVLKIMTGSGSEYMFVSDNEDEFRKNFADMKSSVSGTEDTRLGIMKTSLGVFDTRKQFLLEEFANGDEYSMDFCIDGKVKIIRVVKKTFGKRVGYFAGFQLLNRDSIDRMLGMGRLEDACRKIALALQVKKGVCMVDFKFNHRMHVIETAVRPGLSTFIHLMDRLYGYTSLYVLHDLLMGRDFDKDIPQDEGLIVYLLAEHAGMIKQLQMDAHGLPGYLDSKQYCQVGTVLKDYPYDHNDLLVGYVLLKNPQDVEAAIKQVKKKISVKIA
jgi:hypothetical protein